LGAADGISNVPGFSLVPGIVVSGSLSARVMNYYIAWAVVLVGLVLLVNLINSRVGRSLRALHGGEEAADSMGVDTARMKLSVFVLAAVFAAVAGVLTTHYNGGIGPSEASATKSVRYVAIVAVGGMANLWGTLTMAVLLNFLSLRGAFGTYDDAVFAAVLILIMLFAPDGFLRVSVLRDVRRAAERVLAATRRRGETGANPLVPGRAEKRSLPGHLGDTAPRGGEEP
jgi:branched-chain amino acid transport system permease protein